MGLILQKNLAAGAPEIEDAIYDARFDGVTEESHPDWAGPNKFGGMDDGERWRFAFTLLNEEDGSVMYNGETGNPVVVDVLTNQTMGKKANAYAIMSGILTKGEREKIDAGEPFDSESLIGRVVQVVVEHNSAGWPKVASVIPARAGSKAKAAKPAAAPVEAPAAADEDDEEAQLLAQIEARKAAKAAAAAAPADDEKAAKLAALKAQLAELEGE